MNIAITICVPSNARQFANWGDLYYAQSMKVELELMGHQVRIFCMDEWPLVSRQEILIHLRGLHHFVPKNKENSFLWIINHPELIGTDEIRLYKHIFSASESFTQTLLSQNVSASYLPQAGDHRHFFPLQKVKKEIDVLFVGNNHQAQFGKARKIIEDIFAYPVRFNLKIVGAAWKGLIKDQFLLADFVEWNDLNQLYQSARIVLNDHQDTMRQFGFINNRTYDLVMAEQFQICDTVSGLEDLGIMTYQRPDELSFKISDCLNNDIGITRNNKIVKQLAGKNNFQKRMDELIAIVEHQIG